MPENPLHESHNPQTDKPIKLEDVVNLSVMRGLLDLFDFPVSILNLDGKVLLRNNWEPICSEYHRKHPKTAEKCRKSDSYLNHKVLESEDKYILYRCENGLNDIISPIVIDGQHMGNMYIEQFLLEEPDEAFFRRQAEQYGFPPAEYLEMLSKVSVISEPELKKRLQFLKRFAELLGNDSIRKNKTILTERALKESEQLFTQMFEQSSAAISLFNPDGTYFRVNSAHTELMGIKPEHILDSEYFNVLSYYKMFHADLLPVIEDVFRQGRARRWEYRLDFDNIGERIADITDKTGAIDLSVQAYPILNEQNQPRYIAFIYIDISKRKISEQALKESEEKYRMLLENINDVVFIVNNDFLKFFNPKLCEMSGYTEKELYDNNFFNIVHPDDHALIYDRNEKRYRGELFDDTYAFRMIHKDGSVRWAEMKARLIDWEDDKATLCIIRDITERRQAEEARRESEEQFRMLSEQSLLGISVVQDGRIQYANQMIAEIYEYPVEEVRNMSFDNIVDLIHPDDRDFAVDQLVRKQVGEDGVQTKYSYRIITKTGKIKWCEIYSRTVIYQGQPADLKTTIDITERKKAEDALSASEEKYRKVVDNAIEAIYVIQHDRFKYFNPVAEKLFGYSAEELKRISPDETIFPDDREIVKLKRRQREQGELSQSTYIQRIVTRDGLIRWVDIKAVTISWEEEPATLVFLTDITERKKTEELMIQTEKMMSVGGLAAGMAHELNNPLGGILQGVFNLQRRLSAELKSNLKSAAETGIDLQKLQSYLEKREIPSLFKGIQDSGKKAADIISNMLQFSRRSQSEMARISLEEMIENVIELAGKSFDLRKKYDFRSIQIVKEIEPGIPLIPCTQTQIEQVFLNLLNNAAAALAQKGGDEPSQIIIRAKPEKTHIRVELEDNGPGMEDSVRKRIFEPFYTTKPPGEGTGLGLSVSYMIITNNHGGTMEVESTPGKGTRFTVRLPRAPGTVN